MNEYPMMIAIKVMMIQFGFFQSDGSLDSPIGEQLDVQPTGASILDLCSKSKEENMPDLSLSSDL